MQILPIGEQGFKTLRTDKKLYVDKTEHIQRLITGVKYCFLSRPRRFGKSLTLSTISEIFKGSRDLFEGLWIENNWDWSKIHPVVHIPCNRIGYANLGLENALIKIIREHAVTYGVVLEETTCDLMFRELILKLAAAHDKVVLLIDEYDKPIIDYLEKEDLPTAKAHRKILKTFYSGLKDDDSQTALRFFMITGVSKFSQVSIFSDLNYLDDITLNPHYGALTGYTQAELESNFAEWLQHALTEFPEETESTLLELIKEWYDGYSWNGKDHMYNPFSILGFFSNGIFQDYWFKTGTPSFLIGLLKEQGVFMLDDMEVNKTLFESYDLENMDVRSLLFQTGYLTIKHIDRKRGRYTLDYPNREVSEAMQSHIIAALLGRQPSDSTKPIFQLEEAFLKNDPAKVVTIINSLLKDVPALSVGKHDERFYHALVHLHFHYLGLFMDSEVHTSDGRMDAVVQTGERIFILEFKLDESAAAAMQQIRDKGYAEKYRLSGKTLVGMGIHFNSDKRSVDEWLSEEI